MRIQNILTSRSSPGWLLSIAMLAFMFTALAGCGASPDDEQAEQGDSYPADEMELVVPYPPGGGYDTWARLLAPFLEEHLPGEVRVIVRNAPGAGGQTAAAQLYAARPDGSRIDIMNLTGLAAAEVAGTSENLQLTEFTHLARIARDYRILVAEGNSDINTVEDLRGIAPVKNAVAGLASVDGVAGIITYETLGIDHTQIVHEGQDEARLSVIRGDTDTATPALESTIPELQAGDLKAILYIGEEKPEQGDPGYEEVRDVQTAEDAGYPELADGSLDTQITIAAPPGLPEDIKQMLDKAILDALNDPGLAAAAAEADRTPSPLNSDETTELVDEVLGTLLEYEDILREALEGR